MVQWGLFSTDISSKNVLFSQIQTSGTFRIWWKLTRRLASITDFIEIRLFRFHHMSQIIRCNRRMTVFIYIKRLSTWYDVTHVNLIWLPETMFNESSLLGRYTFSVNCAAIFRNNRIKGASHNGKIRSQNLCWQGLPTTIEKLTNCDIYQQSRVIAIMPFAIETNFTFSNNGRWFGFGNVQIICLTH